MPADNLYLDMNGIIHACSHGNSSDGEVCEAPNEREVMQSVFGYVDRVVTEIVKPKKVLYIAVDGVAPRAKLNQQRSRRFGSAKAAREARRGLERSENEFDSNCITPGTEFMVRVCDQLRQFVRAKVAEGGAVWGEIKVIFSGADYPGEGEHKIMQFIRENRPQHGADERHCMYGNDADLIMLALVTHEPHFTLLREIIDFGANLRRRDTPVNARKTALRRAKTSDFQLMHLSVLREYLQLEFCVADGVPEPWDLERLIDDFVLLTFFVGNDFLPHSPSLDISENAFDRLFSAYRKLKKERWGPGGYLTRNGAIEDGARLRALVEALAAMEPEIFARRAKLSHHHRRRQGQPRHAAQQVLEGSDASRELYYGQKCLRKCAASSAFLAGNKTAADAARSLGAAFVEGLQWCLLYYVVGCVDWAWFYPCHYCPYLSDVAEALPGALRTFDALSGPLSPLEQLMSCLPPDSARLVPKPHRDLMTLPSSPLADMYPTEFEVDIPHGKQHTWEGVNLLPFIDMDRMLSAVSNKLKSAILSPDEEKRARFGRTITVSRTAGSDNGGLVESDASAPTNRAPWLHTGPPFAQLVREPCRLPSPGFPSLHALPLVAARPRPLKLNCFGTPSRYSTLTLELPASQPELLDTTVKRLIGESVYVDWPMTREAKLVSGRDARRVLDATGERQLSKDEIQHATEANAALREKHLVGRGAPGDGGLDTQTVEVVLTVAPLRGLGCDLQTGALFKLFDSDSKFEVPVQLALAAPPHGHVVDSRFQEQAGLPLDQRFKLDSEVVLLAGRYRGALGHIKAHRPNGQLQVEVREDQFADSEPPFGFNIARALAPVYASLDVAAQALNLAPAVFELLISSLVVVIASQDRDPTATIDPSTSFDLGLRLRFAPVDNPANRFVLLGYCRRSDENQYEFSAAAIRLVEAYRSKFPAVFEAAAANVASSKKHPLTSRSVFGSDDSRAMLEECVKFLERLPTNNAPRIPETSTALAPEAVKAIQRAAAKRAALRRRPSSKSCISLPAADVFPADLSKRRLVYHRQQQLKLGDRVVNLCVPGVAFADRGVVVAAHATGDVDVVFDEPFAAGTALQGACDHYRGALCDPTHVFAVRLTADLSKHKNPIPKPLDKPSFARAANGADDEGDEIVLVAATQVETTSTAKPSRLRSNRIARGPDGTQGFDPKYSVGRRTFFEARSKRKLRMDAAKAETALIATALKHVQRRLVTPNRFPLQGDDDLDHVSDAPSDEEDVEQMADVASPMPAAHSLEQLPAPARDLLKSDTPLEPTAETASAANCAGDSRDQNRARPTVSSADRTTAAEKQEVTNHWPGEKAPEPRQREELLTMQASTGATQSAKGVSLLARAREAMRAKMTSVDRYSMDHGTENESTAPASRQHVALTGSSLDSQAGGIGHTGVTAVDNESTCVGTNEEAESIGTGNHSVPEHRRVLESALENKETDDAVRPILEQPHSAQQKATLPRQDHAPHITILKRPPTGEAETRHPRVVVVPPATEKAEGAVPMVPQFSEEWIASSDARLEALEERVRNSVREKNFGPYLTDDRRSSVTDRVVGFTFGLQPILPEERRSRRTNKYEPQTSCVAKSLQCITSPLLFLQDHGSRSQSPKNNRGPAKSGAVFRIKENDVNDAAHTAPPSTPTSHESNFKPDQS